MEGLITPNEITPSPLAFGCIPITESFSVGSDLFKPKQKNVITVSEEKSK